MSMLREISAIRPPAWVRLPSRSKSLRSANRIRRASLLFSKSVTEELLAHNVAGAMEALQVVRDWFDSVSVLTHWKLPFYSAACSLLCLWVILHPSWWLFCVSATATVSLWIRMWWIQARGPLHSHQEQSGVSEVRMRDATEKLSKLFAEELSQELDNDKYNALWAMQQYCGIAWRAFSTVDSVLSAPEEYVRFTALLSLLSLLVPPSWIVFPVGCAVILYRLVID